MMHREIQGDIKYEFGLIGYPLGHSFSAALFNEKFNEEKIPATYTLMPLENITKLPDILNNHLALTGLNVTIPLKEVIIGQLDALSQDVKEIGAVNVVTLHTCSATGKKILKGYNTDWVGFLRSLSPLLHHGISKALILGTGGAAKAAAYALQSLGIKTTFVSRRSAVNSESSNANRRIIRYQDMTSDLLAQNLLIVNATPVGMFPNVSDAPDIPYQWLTPSHVCFDMVYNPLQTEFMRRCALRGASVINGLEMLRIQAEEAWEIWTRENPELNGSILP